MEATQGLASLKHADSAAVDEEDRMTGEPSGGVSPEAPRAESRGPMIQAKQQQLAVQHQALSQTLAQQTPARERMPRRQKPDGKPDGPGKAEKDDKKADKVDNKQQGGGHTAPPH